MKKYIGLVGEIGSGKGSFVKTLREIAPDKKIEVVKGSGALAELLDILGLEKSRENLRNTAYMINDHFGIEVFSKAVVKKAEDTNGDIIIIDGLRWPSDFEAFKTLPSATLIYITADQKVRYSRIINRGEKAGENLTSFEEFKAQEQEHNETFIPEYGKGADLILDNSENDFKIFKKKVNELYSQL